MRFGAIIIAFAAWIIVSTAESGQNLERSPLVVPYGALRDVMHKGKIGPVVDLAALLPNDNLYAIGALSELRGEVTIVGGDVYIAYPVGDDGERIETGERSDEKACLLVTAEIGDWVSVTTQSEIAFDELDQRIVALARDAGVDVSESFPFTIEGRVEALYWHIIDGRRLSAGASSHEEHSGAAVKRDVSQGDAILVGFYSDQHHGVFTHMGSNTHIHCVLDSVLSSGHVADVVLPKGLTVRFPKVKEEKKDD